MITNGKKIGRLHVITDTVSQYRYKPYELVEFAIAGGADCIQYRTKNSNMHEVLKEATEVFRVTSACNVPLIINDRIDICLALGADGVHLGLTDLPIYMARKLLGESAIIGATARNILQARSATVDGADYVGVGPVFATTSKHIDHNELGLRLLAEIARESTIPVIGIAGINDMNAADVLMAGAYGVAVIGAVCAASDPKAATSRLSGIIRAFLPKTESSGISS